MLNIVDKEINIIQPTNKGLTSENTQLSNASIIINYLWDMNIDVVFGVPGGALEPFMNALAQSERIGGPRFIAARHECSAAFMADGYYRETGKMGVACSTTGPGATNLITGVCSAKVEEIPMLIITAQTPLPKFGKGALQDSSCSAIDTVAMFKHATLLSTLVSNEEQLESKLFSAIMTAHRDTRGPVHLSIPSDILRATATPKKHINKSLLTQELAVIDEAAVVSLGKRIAQAKNIVLFIGSGAANASRQLMTFIERSGATFITGPMDKGWANEHHPQYRGVYGFAGHTSAHDLLSSDEVDLILAIGTPLHELETNGWQQDLLNTKLVHIDASIEHFTRSSMASLQVYGNIANVFERLLKELDTLNYWHQKPPSPVEKALCDSAPARAHFSALEQSAACISNRMPIKPQRLMHSLNKFLPCDTRIFIDAGNAWAWATHYLNSSNDKGHYRIAMGFGSMTWSIGAAIGSAVGNPEAATLCIVGDGSYLMCAQEITVAVQQELPIVFLILNDSAMGMVMHGQQLGGQESIGWKLNDINYARLAQALGAEGTIIEDPRDLDKLDWATLFKRKRPTLLDLRIDRDEVPPMQSRVKGLAKSASITPGG